MRAYYNEREGDQLANLIFTPDPLSRFRYEHLHGGQKSPAPPEIRALMFAVLEDAIACIQAGLFKPWRRNQKLFQEAQEWIHANDDGVFSFSNICETLAIQPENFRKGLERWKAKQKGVRIEERRRLILNKGKCRKKKITAQGSTSSSTTIQQRELRAI